MIKPELVEKELASVINHNSLENGSNTPDFILARFVYDCLLAWTKASNRREAWYGMKSAPRMNHDVELDELRKIKAAAEKFRLIDKTGWYGFMQDADHVDQMLDEILAGQEPPEQT